jgi:hypothetical protein
MTRPTEQELKERFFQVYANVPLQLRDQVVVVLDDQPVSWKAAFIEVRADSKNGTRILETLAKLEII